MIRKVLILALLTPLVACSDAKNLPTAPTIVEPPPTQAEPQPDAGVSCPHDAPSLTAGGVDLRVDLNWTAVGKVPSYEIEIDRLEANNEYVRVAARRVTGTRLEWYGTQGSRYRARVRGVTSCGTYGLWSNYALYTIDGAASPAPEPSPTTSRVCASRTLTAYEDGDMQPLSLPPGRYRVQVEIRDDAHRPGYQPDQADERVWVLARVASGHAVDIGTTGDLPEALTSATFEFTASFIQPVTDVLFKHAAHPGTNPNSVHGVCATFTR